MAFSGWWLISSMGSLVVLLTTYDFSNDIRYFVFGLNMVGAVATMTLLAGSKTFGYCMSKPGRIQAEERAQMER